MIRRTALFLVLAALTIRADEPAPATDDAIAKAKRDYEAMKAAKAGTDTGTPAALPKQDAAAFDLHLTADLPGPSSSPNAKKHELDKALAAKKSANWLVDAMTDPKASDGKDGRDPFALRPQDGSGRLGEPDLLAQDRALAREKEGSAAQAAHNGTVGADKRATTAEAPNPLAHYMAAWMTPQDLALLNASKAGAAPGLPRAGVLPSPGEVPSVGAPGLADLTPPGTEPEGAAAELGNAIPGQPPKENPYLADLTLPAPPPMANAPASVPGAIPSLLPPTPASGPAMPGAPAIQPPARVSPLLEQIQKEQDDAKYFKQLKRF